MYFIQRSIVYIQIISNVVSCMSCISLSWKEFVPWKKHYMEIDTERWFLTLSFARIFQVLCEQSSKSLSRLEFSAQKIRFEFAGCFFLRFFFITCLVLIPLWLKCVASQPETAVAVGLFLFSWVSKDLAQRIPPGHAQILTRDLALALGSRVHSLHRFKDFKNDWWNDLHFWTSREGRVDLKRDSVLRRVPHWVCILLDCTLVLNVARGKWFFQNRNGEKTIRKQFLFQVFAVFFPVFVFILSVFVCFFFEALELDMGKTQQQLQVPGSNSKNRRSKGSNGSMLQLLDGWLQLVGWLPLHCLHWDLKYPNSASNFGGQKTQKTWISFHQTRTSKSCTEH